MTRRGFLLSVGLGVLVVAVPRCMRQEGPLIVSIGRQERTVNYRIGRISQWLYPHYSHCEKCQTTWNLVDDRPVYFEKGSSGFALCQLCWDESTVEERVRYFRKVYNEAWKDEHNWDLVERAVREGRTDEDADDVPTIRFTVPEKDMTI